MTGTSVFALVDPSHFTGFEQTRVMDLITVLAFASVVIWLIIVLGMIVRHLVILGAVMGIKLKQRKILKRRLGASNGS
jgi:hypothetical protein